MFLNKLTTDEKETFMSLALRAAEANDVIADEEYVMLEEYRKEMEIAFFDSHNAKSIEQIIEFFKKSEEVSKKIILFEILGLMYADGEYDIREKEFMNSFVQKIGLTIGDLEKQTALLLKYLDVTREVADEILY